MKKLYLAGRGLKGCLFATASLVKKEQPEKNWSLFKLMDTDNRICVLSICSLVYAVGNMLQCLVFAQKLFIYRSPHVHMALVCIHCLCRGKGGGGGEGTGNPKADR